MPTFRDSERVLFGGGPGLTTFKEYYDALRNPQALSQIGRAHV